MIQAAQVAIYGLCFVTSGIGAVMLLRGFARTRTPLLFWAGLCFGLLCINNVAVLFDILVFPSLDLQLVRHAASLSAVSVLLIGLVWESE